MNDFDRRITELNFRFLELFGLERHKHSYAKVLDYYFDLYYSKTHDKVLVRLYRNIPNYTMSEITKIKQADVFMSLPEFILHFANPEGAYILEELSFRNF